METLPLMDWNKLFSGKRLDDTSSTHSADPVRSEYEKDFDRVVFSSAFRRLQDKTQVIPLPESDFVHSRLTHSLEVSCVGRSLGKIVGKVIIKKYELDNITESDFGNIVAAACLAHDIGNPPFGHSGESAISNYFIKGNGSKFQAEINDKEKWSDLISFEGNANGFRLLTKNSTSSSGGLSLTFTTLAAFSKYTCGAYKNEKIEGRASQEKYGYFNAEKNIFENVFSDLGVSNIIPGSWLRHPLAFLVEAADDICYRIIDFEDGVRIGLVPFEKAESLLIKILKDGLNQEKYDRILDGREKLGYLRSKVINVLINEVSEIFIKNEEEILYGKYDKHLTDELICKEILKEIRDISAKKIYNSKTVLQIEIAGFNVIAELLDYFIPAINDLHKHGKDLRKNSLLSSKLIQLLPIQFIGKDSLPHGDLYLRILNACEFIAGMTDGYAMTLYKRLKGIELPGE
jgi:dGTPase